MAWHAKGYDSTVCGWEKISTDLHSDAIGQELSHNTATYKLINTFTPTPAEDTDYLVIMQVHCYVDVVLKKADIQFKHGSTVLDVHRIQSESTSQICRRACVYIGKLTIPASPTKALEVWVRVTGTVGSPTVFYKSDSPIVSLFRWDSFVDQQRFESNVVRAVVSTSWVDVNAADHLTFTPSLADRKYLVLGTAHVGGGLLAGGKTAHHRFSLDGVTKMESNTIVGTGASGNENQFFYLHGSMETLAATSKVFRFQGRKGASGIGGGSWFGRQAIFVLGIPPGGRIASAAGSFLKEKIGVVAHG